MITMQVGQEVRFTENAAHPRVLGTVTRVWPNGRYVTIVSDGRTFVRDIAHITVACPTRACGVCGGSGGGPCQTPSGRHWYALDGGDPGMPDELRIALTDAALRTAEEQAALERWSS